MAAWVALAFCVPFVVTTFPPATDLPQHVAQLRLLVSALHDPHGPYAVQWLAPNSLAYVFVGLGWVLSSPLVAGRIALAGILVAWIVATAALADARKRSAAGFVVGSLFAFSHVLYWGFLEFLVGWPCFAAFVALVAPVDRPVTTRRWIGACIAAIALYAAHVLWLGAAVGVVFAMSLADRRPLREALARIAPLGPMLVVAAVWSIRLRAERTAGGFDVAAHWYVMPWLRLAPSYFVRTSLGGLRGPLETGVLALVAMYFVAAIHTAVRRGGSDRALLAASAMFGAVALVAPDMYLGTLAFASRWLPFALVSLALALPQPAWRPNVLRRLALGTAMVFVAVTTAAWAAFEQELTGLDRALAVLPANARIVGLDFVRYSDVIEAEPFFQMFAYAQALHGGELNFSFAEHGSSLVHYRVPRPVEFGRGLEWHPMTFRARDAAVFDAALVNALPSVHEQFAHLPGVVALTTSGRWRAYRFVHAASR